MAAMTKTEVRAWLKRSREGLRWAEEALKSGNLQDLKEAMTEATGSAAEVQQAAEDTDIGVRGLT